MVAAAGRDTIAWGCGHPLTPRTESGSLSDFRAGDDNSWRPASVVVVLAVAAAGIGAVVGADATAAGVEAATAAPGSGTGCGAELCESVCPGGNSSDDGEVGTGAAWLAASVLHT